MKFLNTVLTLTLLIKILQSERTKSYEDYQAKRATQQPLEQPSMNSPTKYTRERLKPSIDYPRPVYANGRFKLTVDDNGIITSTTANSKYSLEQLRAFYKINPYTNKPYHYESENNYKPTEPDKPINPPKKR